uniref:Uncharacterized protein n=1 Tax=Sarcophilus harrisii TaxID=9305 RepID=A0A7N4PXQ8_SARHA
MSKDDNSNMTKFFQLILRLMKRWCTVSGQMEDTIREKISLSDLISRPIYLPPMALTPLKTDGLSNHKKLRKLSKPLYFRLHNEAS